MTQEKVLVVRRTSLEDLSSPVTLNDAELWLGSNIGSAYYVDRGPAETSRTVVQLIPYVVLKCRDRYATYTRGQKGTEDRLHGLLSVGLGGHINPRDGKPGLACLEAAMQRELDEEVLLGTFTKQLKGLLWDPSTPVGRVHLGVVMVFHLMAEAVVPKEAGKIVNLEFLTRSQLSERYARLEPWSRIVVSAML